jgi:LEA14-like dessication related protein
MYICRNALVIGFACTTMFISGCASLQQRDPVQVFVVGTEPLQGQGLELRMLVKLRVQNPNDTPVDFTGMSIQMDVQGKRFASGVSGTGGSVPRFGETVIEVPVSISAFRVMRQAVGLIDSASQGKLTYELTGKLAGSNVMRFKSKGEFTLPEIYRTPESP